jgi:hypothetical protein
VNPDLIDRIDDRHPLTRVYAWRRVRQPFSPTNVPPVPRFKRHS